MNRELLEILEQICELEGMDCTFGVWWRPSGSVWTFSTGGSAVGYGMSTASGYRHHMSVKKDPMEAALDVLAKLQERLTR
jgi:hypothetical protein